MKTIKQHWVGIALAIVIGLVTLLPQLFAIAQLGDAYNGLWPIHGSDDMYYGARAQEVIDGHPRLVNPYLAEHKDGQPLQFWIPDYLVTAPLHALGVPVPALHYIFDFVFPVVLTLLTYWIGWLLTKNKWLALLMPIVFHGGVFLGLFGRPVSPQFVFVFCLSVLGGVLRYIQTQQAKWLWVVALSTGFLFHAYTYYWTFYVVVFGVFAVWALVQFRHVFPIWKLIGTWMVGALIGIPYFMQLVSSRSLPGYEETLTRLGMLQTHFPSGIMIVGIGGMLTVFFVIALWKKWLQITPISALMLSGVIGSVIVTNHHIVTGQNLEFSSHYWPIAAFWFGFSALVLFAKLKQTIPQLSHRWIMPVLVVLSVVVTLPMTKDVVARQLGFSEKEVRWQQYGDVIDWLNTNTVKDEVVFVNKELGEIIPIHTHNNVWFTRWANLHFMTDVEVWERFVTNNYWEEFSEEFVRKNERSIFGTAFINHYNHIQQQNKLKRVFGATEKQIERYPQERIAEFMTFASAQQQTPLPELLSQYQLDYIIWDTVANPEWEIDSLGLAQVATIGQFNIYAYTQF